MKNAIIFSIIVALILGGYYFYNKKNVSELPKDDTMNYSIDGVNNETNNQTNSGTNANINNEKSNVMTIKTNMGEIKVELYKDKAPKTVENFEKLANSGFYSGIRFHRVIKGFMVQAGDPQSKDNNLKDRWGTGGPGYSFADEINTNDEIYKTGYVRGTLAMANSGPNTNGSQFFIMHTDVNLPPLYTIFGKVVSGLEVVDKIANVPTYLPGQVDRPLTDVIINSITQN